MDKYSTEKVTLCFYFFFLMLHIVIQTVKTNVFLSKYVNTNERNFFFKVFIGTPTTQTIFNKILIIFIFHNNTRRLHNKLRYFIVELFVFIPVGIELLIFHSKI